MNYYKRFVGDYQRDTARLSMLQHGAYTLLLDEYYATEKALPLDVVEIYRIARALTDAEQKAINTVLELYWTKTAEGWVNSRAERQILDDRERIKKARESGALGGRVAKFLRDGPRGTEPSATATATAGAGATATANGAATATSGRGTTPSPSPSPTSKTSTDSPTEETATELARAADAAAPETEEEKEKRRKAQLKAAETKARMAAFPAFWTLYPRKRGKGKAEQSWKGISADLHPAIMAALKREIASKDWQRDNGDFIPHPATWLNQRRWEDEVRTPGARPQVAQDLHPCAQDGCTRAGSTFFSGKRYCLDHHAALAFAAQQKRLAEKRAADEAPAGDPKPLASHLQPLSARARYLAAQLEKKP